MQLVHALGKEGQDRVGAGQGNQRHVTSLTGCQDRSHVRREQNQVAHGIAQLALRQVMCKTPR
jgi:hypothetical protein